MVMQLPFPHRKISRGQALVEFALILPLLILLLLMTIDLGRVFFGWVALNNATRIGANEAAKNPDSWASGAGDAGYYLKMSRDLEAINCDADVDNDGVVDSADLPDPIFAERTGDPLNHYEAGDLVTVTLHCDFGLLTPLVGAIVGDPLVIGATSTFMVFGGEIAGIPVASEPEVAGCIGVDLAVPNLVGLTVAEARTAWTNAGFTGSFTPLTGSDADTVLTQTTSPSSTPGGCLVYTATVSVTHKAPDGCSGTEIKVPNLVTLTVAAARSAWTGAGFTGGFTPLTGSDTDMVSAQTTSTGALVGECTPLTTQVNVTHAPPAGSDCTMTQVIGMTPAAAQNSYYNVALFTGAFTIQGNSDPGWVVKTQNLVGGQSYPCTANLQVQLQKP
jgi:beta-lactam-binding protein with PASTA domain